MALVAGTSIETFGGSVQVITGATQVVDDAFSAQGDCVAWTNSQNASFASFLLTAIFASAPTVNTPVNLYARLINISGTDDELIPSTTYQPHFLGSLIVGAATNQWVMLADAPLPNGQDAQQFEFFIENKSGQTLTAATWNLAINPKGFTVAA